MTAQTLFDAFNGKRRGDRPRTGERVWRNSYYEGQCEARLWRPFAGGDMRGAKRRIGAILRAARELERKTRLERQKIDPGARNGILGHIGLDVLDALYNKFLQFSTGQLDPAVETIARHVGHSYAAVHAALKRLRTHGFLHWMRRTRPKGGKGEAGPQVEQIPNAYALLLPKPLEDVVRHLLGRSPTPDDLRAHREQRHREYNEMLSSLSAADFLKATWDGDQLAGESLARIARTLDERESSKSGVIRGV